ncbi:MAG: trigger factor [Flavobacteriales bacterium]
MQIQKHELDALNAELTIHVQPEDYQERVEKALKNYRKHAQIPGFRPGHVPVTIIKKRYGKSILAEEINNLLQDNIHRYIAENKIEILGSPMPKNDQEEVGNWDNPGDFQFRYELGLAPSFELQLDKSQKFTYHKVDITEELINRQVNDYARRYGKMEEPEVSGPEDMMMVELTELDAEGQPIENGIKNNSTVSIEFIKDEETRSKLTGLKKEDVVTVNPHHLTSNHDDLAQMLGIAHQDVHHLQSSFQLKVNEIKHIVAHELDQELFDKLYGKDVVTTESEMRERTKSQLENTFSQDSDYLFKREFRKEIIKRVNPQLPDEFLKRFIMMTNEKPVTAEIVDYEYPMYAGQLRWQLIENKILRQYEIRVTPDEAREHVKSILRDRYAQYGLPEMEAEHMDEMAKRALGNKEEEKQVYDFLFEEKMMAVVKENCTIEEMTISLDDFIHRVQH